MLRPWGVRAYGLLVLVVVASGLSAQIGGALATLADETEVQKRSEAMLRKEIQATMRDPVGLQHLQHDVASLWEAQRKNRVEDYYEVRPVQ